MQKPAKKLGKSMVVSKKCVSLQSILIMGKRVIN